MKAKLVMALAFGLAVSGCSDDTTRSSEGVTLNDGGYALVEVVIPPKHTALIRFSYEGAGTGESFAVFDEPEEPPFHTGWFDMSPWMAACEHDPTTSPCLDVHTQKAGAFVGVARRKVGVPEISASCECTGKYECTHYYAIVAGERGPDRNVAVIVDTTKNLSADAASISQIR